MTETTQAIEESSATAKHPRTRWLRLRIIPGTFLLIFTTIGIPGFYFEMWQVLRINTKYDWTQVNPLHPNAITLPHVAFWLLSLIALQACGVSTFAWFDGNWKVASIGTAIFSSLMFATKFIESL